jgi:hypothetical protein
MQAFQRSPFALREQIESAYENGGVSISPIAKLGRAIGCREPAIRFTYRGDVSPFCNKADRFHVGRFSRGLKLSPNVIIGTSVMRECCKNVLFTPLHLSNDDVRLGLTALKRTKMTKAAIRKFVLPHLPTPHHRSAIQDLDGDPFEVVDVLTAMGRAEGAGFIALGLFAGLLMTSATSVPHRAVFEVGLISRCKTKGDL